MKHKIGLNRIGCCTAIALGALGAWACTYTEPLSSTQPCDPDTNHRTCASYPYGSCEGALAYVISDMSQGCTNTTAYTDCNLVRTNCSQQVTCKWYIVGNVGLCGVKPGSTNQWSQVDFPMVKDCPSG